MAESAQRTGNFSGVRKAAILLVAIGEELATEILRSLPEPDVQRLTEELKVIAEVSTNLDQSRRRREELAAAIDADLRRRYETIFTKRRGLAVVEVRGGSCQGCHMRVAPQLFNDIQRTLLS